MNRYRVTVPFEALMREDLETAAVSAELPASFALNGIAVDRADDEYRAVMEVLAPSGFDARVIAAERLQEVLAVLATYGDAFKVRIGRIGVHRISGSGAELTGSLTIIPRRSNLDFGTRAFSWRDRWPEWLSIAVSLNYQAELSDRQTAFVTHCTGLEVLVQGLLGRPVTILSELDKTIAVQIVGAIRGVLADAGVGQGLAERVLARIHDAQSESPVDRLIKGLARLDVPVSAEDARLVTKRRGALAHTGQASDKEQTRRAANFARGWLQSALRYILVRPEEFGDAANAGSDS